MSKVDEITQTIGRNFSSFGGGQEVFNNPVAEALKDKPLQFAAGVDMRNVVSAVLNEVGFDDLLEACEVSQWLLGVMVKEKHLNADNTILLKLDAAIAKGQPSEAKQGGE